MHNNNNKRRQNNMGGGMGGQQRHGGSNRPRRFGGGGGNRMNDDSANVVRVRRNATQAREKYQNMARDAMSMGDRVLAENYLQHAEHYYRVLLSLPPEEVRQPHNRNMSQQDGEGHAEDGQERVADGHGGEEAHHGEDASKVLPAFITQPAAQENTPE
ncbi:MAG TPA: DUF4167 domain-containing protein [Rickettsiales bacterium]|nr:DUF4167 domain-containing protein [Rickettsiales bacterium]